MSVGADNSPLGAAQSDVSPESLEKVRAVFSALSKFVLGKKIYAQNNPTLVKFGNEFDAALHDFFIEEDELVVSLDKFSIRWEDEIVYENDKRDESLAFLLYKDGMGELSIQRSVTPQEMEALVDLIKDEVRNPSKDEDVVTKFWKADFENISYRVLDEYLVGEFGEGRFGEGESAMSTLEHDDHPEVPSFNDKGRILVGDGEDLESISYYLRSLVLRGKPQMTRDDEEEFFQNAMESIFGVSAGELRFCQDELLRQKQSDSLVSFIDGYFDFALMTENSSVVRDVMNVIECLVDRLISELNPVVLGQTLASIEKFEGKQVMPPNIQAFCENLRNRLTNPSLLLSLGETVGNLDGGSGQVFDYYKLAGEKAIGPILKLLEDNNDPRIHKRACDTLVVIAGDGIAKIIDGLNIDKPQIARDVVRLIKETKPDQVPQVIKELMYYPDFQVRAEAIHFLAGFGDDDSALLLVRLLDDTEKNTRIRAITEMSEMDHPIVKNRIEEVAFGKDLATREQDEQIEIYRSLGKLCGAGVLPRLQSIVGKNPLFFFGRKKKKGTRLLAAYALEQIRDGDAKAMLENLAKDSDERVRTKAQQVLDALEAKDGDRDPSDD